MKKKRGFAGILESLDEARDRRLERKLPGWTDRGIVVPSSLALEQCSSSATASYKVRLALSRLGGRPESVCDITGGLGADSAAFAAVAGRLVYMERNPALVEAARANFSALGLDNVEFRCEEVGPGSEIPECRLIVADPARRSESGRKLFRLEDCSPDIGALAPYLLRKAEWLMVKLSPMADISVLAARFGAALREVHVVSSGGEVRELLCLLSREVGEFCGITAVELGAREDGSDECFSFLPEEEKAAEFTAAGRLEPGGILLEPRACLLKAGAFKLPCSRFGLGKLAPSTHLYMTPDGGELPPRGLFRRFVVKEVLPLNSASIRELKSRGLKADVSARNLHLSSDELRRRLGCMPGDGLHVFGCSSLCRGNVLIITGPPEEFTVPSPCTTEPADNCRISA